MQEPGGLTQAKQVDFNCRTTTQCVSNSNSDPFKQRMESPHPFESVWRQPRARGKKTMQLIPKHKFPN